MDNKVVITQTDFSDHFPPTVYGLKQAVLNWTPVSKTPATPNSSPLIRVFNHAHVEEGPAGSYTAVVQAVIDVELAKELEADIGWDTKKLEEELAAYLDHYRPLCIRLVTQVSLAGGEEAGKTEESG